ncbi:MAG: hypothetical protein LBT10_02565 [Methanobrevibacter sp.]|jgi:hypothetical protein|nr:hypothetical protein [Methanobrevibacter sp.]
MSDNISVSNDLNDKYPNLDINAKMSYDKLIQLAYDVEDKFNEMKEKNKFEDLEFLLKALNKLDYEFVTHLPEDLRQEKENKDLFETRKNLLSKYNIHRLKHWNTYKIAKAVDELSAIPYVMEFTNFKEYFVNDEYDDGVEVLCENCGSNNFLIVDGIPTCNSCGTKNPNLDKGKISQTEKLKEQEIKRLTTEEPMRLVDDKGLIVGYRYPDPRTGILTDDEILKYAPKSESAKKIRVERKGGWLGYFKRYGIVWAIIIFLIFYILSVFKNDQLIICMIILFFSTFFFFVITVAFWFEE